MASRSRSQPPVQPSFRKGGLNQRMLPDAGTPGQAWADTSHWTQTGAPYAGGEGVYEPAVPHQRVSSSGLASPPTAGSVPRKRTGSPTSTSLTNSTRVEAAHRRLLDQLAKHEREYDRALRVKQAEISQQQVKLEKLQDNVEREEKAADRARQIKEEKVQDQRFKNVRKQDVYRKNELMQQQKFHEMLAQEEETEANIARIREQRRREALRSAEQAATKEDHRAEVYLRGAMIREAKREETLAQAAEQRHERKKVRSLSERRQSTAERNAFKQAKHIEAKRKQHEEQERMRWQYEAKVNERAEIDAEIRWMGEQIVRDRHELDMALQRLRQTKMR